MEHWYFVFFFQATAKGCAGRRWVENYGFIFQYQPWVRFDQMIHGPHSLETLPYIFCPDKIPGAIGVRVSVQSQVIQ